MCIFCDFIKHCVFSCICIQKHNVVLYFELAKKHTYLKPWLSLVPLHLTTDLLKRQNRNSPFLGKPVISSVHIWSRRWHAAGNPLTGDNEWGGGLIGETECIKAERREAVGVRINRSTHLQIAGELFYLDADLKKGEFQSIYIYFLDERLHGLNYRIRFLLLLLLLLFLVFAILPYQ